MAVDSQTCCTVETPSRLMLFYPESTPTSLTTLLPTQPICKPVGQHLLLGRSSAVDIRLNDERMSRVYAALWHDGKDPFVFRVSNLSERKLLLVDGVMLRYQQEAEVRDGSMLVLDFLHFKAKVCAGDVVAFSYQVTLVKNVVMSPPVSLKPPNGKCLLPPRLENTTTTTNTTSLLTSRVGTISAKPSLENTSEVVNRLLTCLRTGSMDSGMGGSSNGGGHLPAAAYVNSQQSLSFREDADVGVEYELPENQPTMFSGYSPSFMGAEHVLPPPWSGATNSSSLISRSGKQLSLNIPLPRSLPMEEKFVTTTASTSTPLEQPEPKHNLTSVSTHTAQKASSTTKNLSFCFNVDQVPSAPQAQKIKVDDNSIQDLSEITRHVQNALCVSRPTTCQSCRGCDESLARQSGLGLVPDKDKPPRTLMALLPDMLLPQGGGRLSPVKNADWDTDDPNINSYMA